MGPRRGAVDAGVASFSKVIRTSGTRSVRVVGCTRCFPTRPASVPKLDSEGPQRYRCRECGCRSVSKLAGVTRLLSDFLIPHFKLSHYQKRVILVDVDQAAASSILGVGSASLPAALGMVR